MFWPACVWSAGADMEHIVNSQFVVKGDEDKRKGQGRLNVLQVV